MAQDLLEETKETLADSVSLENREQGGAQKPPFLKGLFGSKKKLILFAGIGAVLVMALGLGLFFFFSGPSKEDQKKAPPSPSQAKEDSSEEILFKDILALEPFERIPLKPGSIMGFMSVELSLELLDRKYRMQVYSMEDRIRRVVQNRISEKKWLELRTPEGKIGLKYELLKGINGLFPRVMVRNIYFTNFIMQ